MIDFSILKKSGKSRARLGILKTDHGEVSTPSLVPVATRASIRALTSDDILKTKTRILIANTFHLHLRPGEKIVKIAGGLHKFMNWPRPIMTDSGGFQVFSLGFGRDLGVGKALKYFPGARNRRVEKGDQPASLKIMENGVCFGSPLDGRKIFIGPEESIAIQEKLGADIIFAFDECTPPLTTLDYARAALERTHRWAKACIKAKKSDQALFGIVQGSRFRKLREESAKFINSLDFSGFGIGGDLGYSKKTTGDILNWVIPSLDQKKPRHLLGIGKIEDIEPIIKGGIDLFDCTVPAHYARHGTAFTFSGELNLTKSVFLKDKNPLDKKCVCEVCLGYSRGYIAHLVRAKEMTASALLTAHNLHFFNSYTESVREKIKKGLL